MAARDTADKARRLKVSANEAKMAGPALEVARKNAGSSNFDLVDSKAVKKAADVMRPRMVSDREKTASRAEMIANREKRQETAEKSRKKVDANRTDSREELVKSAAKRAKKIAEAKAEKAAIQKAIGTQAGHTVTQVDRKTGKSK